MKVISKNTYRSKRFNILLKKVYNLNRDIKYSTIIKLLSNNIILKFDDMQISNLFLLRGNAYNELEEYDKALNDYNAAIEFNPNYALAYYNIGTILVSIKRNYNEALKCFEKARTLDTKLIAAHISIASIYRFMKDYSKALEILNYAIAIDSNDANAYYNRGVAKMESYSNWEEAIDDFKKYLTLISPNDSWVEDAKYYISYMENRLSNSLIYKINRCISKLKDYLSADDLKITHYTKIDVLKSLIFKNSDFRLSEGNFLNDKSEGIELFKFLDPMNLIFSKSEPTDFIIKPFIGSFVKYFNKDNLNLWRFYGKNEGEDANGCSITINRLNFYYKIIDNLDKDDEGYNYEKYEINFYYIVYYNEDNNSFSIACDKDINKLNQLMKNLKELVQQCKNLNYNEKLIVEQDLISISFLFKNYIFENEQEIRMLTNARGFCKHFNLESSNPKVYIDLIPLKDFIEHIQFGPKTENIADWYAALYYAYDCRPPSIGVSNLPYK